jgi:hypothetical protein
MFPGPLLPICFSSSAIRAFDKSVTSATALLSLDYTHVQGRNGFDDCLVVTDVGMEYGCANGYSDYVKDEVADFGTGHLSRLIIHDCKCWSRCKVSADSAVYVS